MTFLALKRLNIEEAINLFFWYFYLVLLVFIAFVSGPYKSDSWLMVSVGVYVYTAAYMFFCLCSQTGNLFALRHAKGLTVLLLFALLWLVLQLWLPRQLFLEGYVFGQHISPDWFELTLPLTVVPERTKWVLLSNVMVFILFVLTLNLITHRRRVKEFVWVLLIVGLIHAMLGIFAKYSGVYFVDKANLDGHFEVARGWFINRNHFAAFVSLCLLSALAMQFKRIMTMRPGSGLNFFLKQIIKVSTFAFILGAVALFLSESRGAFLAFFASFILCVGLLLRNEIFRIQRWHFLFFVVFALVSLSLFFGDGMVDRFKNDALNIGERQTQWLITWQAIKQQFWFGYGAGSYELVFQTFREYADLRAAVYDQAHNDYLHIFLEQGLIGLLLWLGFIAFVIRDILLNYRQSKSTLISSTLLAGLIVITAILVQSLVDYPLQIMSIRCYFFVIVALLIAVPHIKHER